MVIWILSWHRRVAVAGYHFSWTRSVAPFQRRGGPGGGWRPDRPVSLQFQW
jgi:hypothetical protein